MHCSSILSLGSIAVCALQLFSKLVMCDAARDARHPLVGSGFCFKVRLWRSVYFGLVVRQAEYMPVGGRVPMCFPLPLSWTSAEKLQVEV